MSKSQADNTVPARGFLRFLVGLAGLVLFAGFFMSGIEPPGVAGEVLHHNRVNDIDASPMVPSEVEHMQELERGVRRQMAAAADHTEAPSARDQSEPESPISPDSR